MKLNTNRIPQWLDITTNYPAMQVETYGYIRPFKEGVNAGAPDEITIRVATKHDNQIFEEIYVFRGHEYDIVKGAEMIKKMKNMIKKNICEVVI